MRALFTRTRASAVRPAKARQMFSSIFMILRTVLMSCSFAAATFSTPEGNHHLKFCTACGSRCTCIALHVTRCRVCCSALALPFLPHWALISMQCLFFKEILARIARLARMSSQMVVSHLGRQSPCLGLPRRILLA